MSIKVTISIDDDRWAKHPYSIKFDDDECNQKFSRSSLNSRQDCYRIIRKAEEEGYDIDPDVEEYFY